jgi:hypothetical protein
MNTARLYVGTTEPCGLYLGTNHCQVFASADEGQSWHEFGAVGASVREC